MTTLIRFSQLADTTAFRAALGLARSIESVAGDWFMNVHTGKPVRFQEQRGLNGDAFDFETNAHTTLVKVMRTVRLLPSDIVFVIGCGRGRAVCHFARRRVRKVVGIELDSCLCEDARSNALSLRGRHASIEIRHADAAAEDVGEGTVFFLFNPFGEQTLRALLRNIESSHTRLPERLVIVYANPRYVHVFQEFEWLTVSHSYCGFGGLHVEIYQNCSNPSQR